MAADRLVFALLALLLVPSSVFAQRLADIDRGDELLAAGRIAAAESLYYRAARQRPRAPSTRLALGRYLAARGALRVGAVLLEEARFFGGDRRIVAAELAPVYARLGDYRALAALPSSPLTSAERRRAEWLASNAPAVALTDSTVISIFPADDGMLSMSIVIESDTLTATIDPGTTGLVLDTVWARRANARLFGGGRDPRQASGVLRQLGIGSASLRNVPTRYTPMPTARARMGLDLIASLHPTFDERAGKLVLRHPRSRVRPVGLSLPTLTTRATLLVATPDTALAVNSARARQLLGGRRWTWLARSGEIVVER